MENFLLSKYVKTAEDINTNNLHGFVWEDSQIDKLQFDIF